jgi:hypothetical protein
LPSGLKSVLSVTQMEVTGMDEAESLQTSAVSPLYCPTLDWTVASFKHLCEQMRQYSIFQGTMFKHSLLLLWKSLG